MPLKRCAACSVRVKRVKKVLARGSARVEVMSVLSSAARRTAGSRVLRRDGGGRGTCLPVQECRAAYAASRSVDTVKRPPAFSARSRSGSSCQR